MILRTPPPRKRRAESIPPEDDSPAGRLVIYEDPPSPQPESSPLPSDHLLCTYQCRQMVKAELLDNYASMEKTIAENQSKLATLNENLLTAEEEGKKYRDQFLYAEQELAAARGREQSLQDKLLKEIKESQERLTKQIQQCNELEASTNLRYRGCDLICLCFCNLVKLQKEESLRRSSESSAAAAEEKANRLERKLNQLSDSTEREKNHLQDELKHLKGDSKLSMSRLRAECLQEKNGLETKISSFTCPEEGSSSSQHDVLVKHLQEELRNYECEVLEARKLKASHENIELLKEKLIEEKRWRERAEADLTMLQEIQLSMNVLEDELASWKKILKEIPGVESSDDVPLKFVALQKEVIDGMSKLGEANTRLKQLEIALEGAESDKKYVESETALAKEREESLKLEIKELKSKLSSVNEERDQLRTAYNELKQQTNVEPGSEAVGRALTQGLESSLAQKDSYIKELEINLSEHKAADDRHHNEIRVLNEKLNSEARKIKSLEREGDRLRSDIALLESKLGHGDFSSANTKVLRMVNPLGVESEARQTIEALHCELQKANEKLQVVEELKKQSADAGQLVDSYISGKIVQLKEQIATLEKREERYKTVFADRISVFRRACCELFGYKIVMDDQHRPNGIPITRFTLQSIYAQSDDEKLEFEYESGNTNILINDYAKQREISRQVEMFIRKLNSIPAFTANLTIESFNRRTLS
uniref:Mitotic spindle checkpoint protein MAD1 n=1 Tax=Chenopodium quinoa TaxID=63459 RepID=A0A803N9K7_CHEQI